MNELERDWEYGYDGAVPPLPEEFPRDRYGQGKPWTDLLQDLLPAGAYFLWFEPRIAEESSSQLPFVLAGVVRIHHRKEGNWYFPSRWGKAKLWSSGSGDLYRCERKHVENLALTLDAEDETQALRALQFPAANYRQYLRLQKLWISSRKVVTLALDTHRYDPGNNRWTRRQAITIRTDREPVKVASPAATLDEYPAYEVFNEQDTLIGTARLVRIACKLRHARVQLHAIPKVATPGLNPIWDRGLGSADWSVEVLQATTVKELEAKEWTVPSLRRFDRETIETGTRTGMTPKIQPWDYHVLVVDRIRTNGGDHEPLGLMFDLGGATGGEFARQCAALAAQRPIDDGGPQLHETGDQFHWAALHELGHMQGLFHNPDDPGLMQPRRDRARPFDPQIDLVHARRDAHRLRHLPDLWVRPGGIPFGHGFRPMPVDLRDLLAPTPGFRAKVDDLVVGIGTPPSGLNLRLTLHNSSGQPVDCPYEESAQMGRGFLGAHLSTPSDDLLDLTEPFPPQRLGDDKTYLHDQAAYAFDVRWPATVELRQVGTYRLSLYLTWLVGRELYHLVAEAAEINVYSPDREGQRPRDSQELEKLRRRAP